MVDYNHYKMSGSDEEFEPQVHTAMSKAELRRVNKFSCDQNEEKEYCNFSPIHTYL